MLILNFSHPLSESQRQQIAEFAQDVEPAVQDIQVQINFTRPLPPQIAAIADAVSMTPREWQTTPFLVNVPGQALVAALLIAELHGRCGYFPPCLVLVRQGNANPPVFEVIGIADLQDQRDAARQRR